MKRSGVVFSSSEYSESDALEYIPQAKNPNNKANLQSDSGSYYYDDYSSSSDDKIVVKKVKITPKPQVNRGINKPIQLNKSGYNNHNQNQNLNQNKRDTDVPQEEKINVQKSVGSITNRGVNRVNRPPPRSIRSPPQIQSQQKKQPQPQQPSKSSPSFNHVHEEDNEIEYNENSSDNQSKAQSSQANLNHEINSKIYSSPREEKARQVNQINNDKHDDDDNAVILTPVENDDFAPVNVNMITKKQSSENPSNDLVFDSITYSVKRTAKRSVHGKSYIFSLIKEGNPVLFSKSNSRHPKGIMPISTNSDIHIKNSSASEYTITAEENCTKFTIKSQQKTILTYTITPSQKEYIKLPHLNIVIAQSLAFSPKEMTSKRPQMNRRGFWFLDFHNKFTLPSEKNAIFVPANPELGGEDLIVVRKIEKDRIEIDVNTTPSDIVVFAIGLSSFLAKYC